MCYLEPSEVIEFLEKDICCSGNNFWWDDFSEDELWQVAHLIVDRGKTDLLMQKDSAGTPFFPALFEDEKNYSVAEYILENVDVDVNMRDEYGNTPLHLVAMGSKDDLKNCEMAEILLKNGANPNIQNKLKDTPLHIAIYRWWKYENFIELLIRAGSDLCIKDADGKTVYDYIIDEDSVLYLYRSIKLKLELEDILKHSPVSKIDVAMYYSSEFFIKIYNYKNEVIYDILLGFGYKEDFLELIKENLHKLDFKNDRFDGDYKEFEKFIKNK